MEAAVERKSPRGSGRRPLSRVDTGDDEVERPSGTPDVKVSIYSLYAYVVRSRLLDVIHLAVVMRQRID